MKNDEQESFKEAFYRGVQFRIEVYDQIKEKYPYIYNNEDALKNFCAGLKIPMPDASLLMPGTKLDPKEWNCYTYISGQEYLHPPVTVVERIPTVSCQSGVMLVVEDKLGRKLKLDSDWFTEWREEEES